MFLTLPQTAVFADTIINSHITADITHPYHMVPFMFVVEGVANDLNNLEAVVETEEVY